jgi:hypothetical protein
MIGVEARFRPCRNFAEGCCTWDLRGHTYDVLSGSSLVGCILIQITVTLSDISDRLLIVVIS